MKGKTPRTADFHVRMTEQERANLDAVASEIGLTRSQTVRLLAQLPTSEIAASNVHLVYIDMDALSRTHREMRRFGTNMNQAAHSLNAIAYHLRNGSVRYEWVEAEVSKIGRSLGRVNEGQREVCEAIAQLESSIFAE